LALLGRSQHVIVVLHRPASSTCEARVSRRPVPGGSSARAIAAIALYARGRAFGESTRQTAVEAYSLQSTFGTHAVIVGRGAAILLHDRPGIRHVFLRAPLAARIARVMARDRLAEGAARRLVYEIDAKSIRVLRLTALTGSARPITT